MPNERVAAQAARLVGGDPASWVRVDRGYTNAERWVARLPDGSSAFVKAAADADTAAWLRREAEVYAALDAPFVPRVIGWSDGELPVLVLEDLSGARWPPPWEPGDVERVLSVLEGVWSMRPPVELGGLEDRRPNVSGWPLVAREPEPFLGLGLCTAAWLELALPVLLEAEGMARLGGDDFVHLDVRSDNICFASGRVVLVDWNLCARGNRLVDLGGWLPSLRLEGGPLPDELYAGDASIPAMLAGYFCSRAAMPPLTHAPRVRWIQLRQARIALPWAARALGLPPPDGAWAGTEIGAAEADLREGRIDEARWFDVVEEVLGDAYLASDDPRAQSGKSGDEAEWEWSRRPVADRIEREATFLDVGCANGHLMESVVRWCAQRGVHVEPHGVDLSWRLASVARTRLPQWADRIWTANATTWTPPKRFDVVCASLDQAVPGRERAYVSHLLEAVVAPGGRLVLRPDRVRPDDSDMVGMLRSWGLDSHEVLVPHPRGRDLRRCVWVEA